MPQLLTTQQISSEIEIIIKGTKKELYIISPYQKLNPIFLERLQDANSKDVNIIFIYGKDKEKDKGSDGKQVLALKKLDGLDNVKVLYCENLHIKCYMNEDALIITSMNIYDFSEKNNRELGILLKREMHTKAYEDTLTEIESIIAHSTVKKEYGKNSIFLKTMSNVVLSDYEDTKEEFAFLEVLVNYKLKSKYFFLNSSCQYDEMFSTNYIYGCKVLLNDKLEFKLCFNHKDLSILHSEENSNKIKGNNYLNSHYQIFWSNYSKLSIYRTSDMRYKWHTLSNETKANYWLEALLIIKPFLDAEISRLKLIILEETVMEGARLN